LFQGKDNSYEKKNSLMMPEQKPTANWRCNILMNYITSEKYQNPVDCASPSSFFMYENVSQLNYLFSIKISKRNWDEEFDVLANDAEFSHTNKPKIEKIVKICNHDQF